MSSSPFYDAVIIGSGPNGLAAAVALVREGLSVKVFEAKDTIGGGARTAELTLPGFRHDVCSAIHPMGVGSPFFASLPLEEHGLEWIYPEYALAHPLDHESAVILQHSVDQTAAGLNEDANAYHRLFGSVARYWSKLAPDVLGPVSIPGHPLLLARFGLKALHSAQSLARSAFRTRRAQALLAGLSAHSLLPLDASASAAVGLVLGAAAHNAGWPLVRGGSQNFVQALVSYFISLGGEIETGRPIEQLNQLPPSKTVFFDVTPQQILSIAGQQLPSRYARKLNRYRYGMGVFKLDLALDGPIPWADERCLRAGTVHLGGTLKEITASEQAVAEGRLPGKPYVLLAQQSLFDDTRAPAGRHTVWAYCHVPNGSDEDMTESILSQIERFAPGFKKRIIGRHATNAQAMQVYNANYIGGDINGGRQDLFQLFTRPAGLFDPYHIPDTSMYICSASTPPGGGVHGMCGYHAAKSALRREFG